MFLKLATETAKMSNGLLILSRACFETGKFLSDPKTKQNQLIDHSGKYYLEKAKVMFEEMDLRWDLEEYRKYLNDSQKE